MTQDKPMTPEQERAETRKALETLLCKGCLRRYSMIPIKERLYLWIWMGGYGWRRMKKLIRPPAKA